MIENIFTEFMNLYYTSTGNRPKELKDIPIKPGIIVRVTDNDYTIHYLTNGNYIRIPWEYIDLFSSLNTYAGDRILHDRMEECTPANKFIKHFVLLTKYLSLGNGDLFLYTLAEICDLGTKDFRDWYNIKFNKNLNPIEFFSPDKNIII
jgi:hypothetical protein